MKGVQQNWPVSRGGLVNRKYAVPVYYGPPPQSYTVMGTMVRNDIEDAADDAKKLGADAIIVLQAGQQYGGERSTAWLVGNTAIARSRPVMEYRFFVAAIRWKR